jgi:hypothetical protein
MIKWKDVINYEGLYSISNLGEIKSLISNSSRRQTILKPYNHNGYLRLNLYDLNGICKKYYVHRLVALTFIPNLENKAEINHIDGNKQNNHVSNLEWCTSSENQKHAIENNLQKHTNIILTDSLNNKLKFRTKKEASLFLMKPYWFITSLKQTGRLPFNYNGYLIEEVVNNV